jgi:hypothetical protein
MLIRRGPMQLILQRLLAERFSVKVHAEQRIVDVFLLEARREPIEVMVIDAAERPTPD